MPTDVAVLGAGVIGLSAGIRLLEDIPDVRVTIFADVTGNETTSRGSGGLWQPYSLGASYRAAGVTCTHVECFSHSACN